ncbi:MAG: proprotein convertase P-domain-containing protein [Thermoanaerobaculia bacterium]|nr:proprotein convertase P-domain-containing protein [Thermoanaerobaculia bacterium]
MAFSLNLTPKYRHLAGLLALCVWAQNSAAEPTLFQGGNATKDEAPSGEVDGPQLGVLTTYPDRPSFELAFPGLPVEDFESGAVGGGVSIVCPAPLDSSGDGVCFAPGALLDGFVVEDVPGPNLVDGLLLVGDGAFGNDSKVLAANTLADSLQISFPDPVEAVGLDLINLPGPADSLAVDVYGPGDVLLGSDTAASSALGDFWGVSSPSPITRLVLTSTINEAEAIDNLAFSVGAFLSFDGSTSVDSCAEPANENGVWEPDEEILLDLQLRASGTDFTSITGTLSSANPAVALIADQASWPDLVAGATASSLSPLRFIVNGDLCAQTLGLTLAVTSDQGSFDIPISGLVGASQAPDVPQPVPDGVPAGVESTLVIDTDVILGGLQVEVDIEHTWVGDLTIRLRSPAATEIVLLDRPGVPSDPLGCANNDVRVTFSDSAVVDPELICSASSSEPWVTGPVLPVAALSAFDGESSQGTWTLTVSDDIAGDLGTLVSWRLIHDPPLGAECTSCVQQSDLSLSKTCPGSSADCLLEVFNLGSSTAFDIEVTDAVPPPLVWAGDDCGAGPPVGGILTWNIAALDAGAGISCLVDFMPPGGDVGTAINVADVTSPVPDPALANNTASAEVSFGVVLAIPMLGEWGLFVLVAMLAGISLLYLRR